MSKNDPVKEFRSKKADALTDTIGELGFGGVADKNVAKAKADASNKTLDEFETKYGLRDASKGPSFGSRIGKAFRNFGSHVSALFSPKAAAAQATPTVTMDAAAQPARSDVAASMTQPDNAMAMSRADLLSKAQSMAAQSREVRGHDHDQSLGL